MRIALFTETFLPKTDGIVNTLCQVLGHLARRGHTSLLFAPAGGPARYAGMPVIGLTAIPFPLYPELKLVPPTVDVSDRLRAFGPDLVHVFNPASLGIAGLRHARQLGVPVAASYQTDLPGFAARWGLGLFSEPLWGFLRWVHDQADLNFCPSRYTQAQLMASGLPVVVPSTGGQVDHVRHGANGLIYDAEDNEALVTAMARLVRDLQRARSLGIAGRTHAEGQRWDQVLAGLVRDWQGIIEPPRLALAA